MKETIRENIWESNSSTTHSLVILPEEIYNKWEEEQNMDAIVD